MARTTLLKAPYGAVLTTENGETLVEEDEGLHPIASTFGLGRFALARALRSRTRSHRRDATKLVVHRGVVHDGNLPGWVHSPSMNLSWP